MQPSALAAKHYSFPVVTGINPQDPLSVRHPRMRIYQKFMNEIDSSGEKLSKNLSEIDLSDPEDVQGLVSSDNSEILLHFGEDNFLNRWHEYQAHLAEWKQQYPRLASVDLRYDRQIVVNPDLRGAVKSQPLSLPATKAAVAAGVKPAALVTPLPTKLKAVEPAHTSMFVAKPVIPPAHTTPKTTSKPTVKKVVTKKKAPVKKVQARPKPKAPVVQASAKTKLPATKRPVSTANKKPSPSIKSQEQP